VAEPLVGIGHVRLHRVGRREVAGRDEVFLSPALDLAGHGAMLGRMSYPPPRYHEPTGEPSGVLRPAATPPDLVIGTRTEVSYLATSESTIGEYGLYRWVMTGEPTGPDPHFHRTISESFYVLDGVVRLYDGRAWTEGRSGDFLYVPPGGVHAFRNDSGERASMLLLFAPGATREAYFEELAEIVASGRALTDEEWADVYARHDQIPA
jgi:mannose-6-phosphate isomerase-like protein (cupin superfamily)